MSPTFDLAEVSVFQRFLQWARAKVGSGGIDGGCRPLLLSKSKYLVGLQCHKALWIHYNDKAAIPSVAPASEQRFQLGHQVGDWAKKLFPGAIDLTRSEGFVGPAKATRRALERRKPIFEAAFIHNGCFSRADILVPVPGDDAWDIFEVKSSTAKDEIPEVYLHDLAFQKYVYEGAGLRVRDCHLIQINRSYVRVGPVDAQKFLSSRCVTEAVRALSPAVEAKVAQLRGAIEQPSRPEVAISQHCSVPYDCALTDICWGFLPESSVFDLVRGQTKSWKLLEQKILSLVDIPTEFGLNDKQARQVESHKSGRPHVDRAAIQLFLSRLTYPMHFLDFETIAPPVPLFDKSRPYGVIPFQFSLHVVHQRGSSPIHHSFLADGQNDPRPALLAQLKQQIGAVGSIVAYNAGFEMRCLQECAIHFPEYADWIASITGRFVDLLDVFRDFAYYHPLQNGSASLKAVLPALTATSYGGLEISEGDTASREFQRITFAPCPPAERLRVRRALEQYCEQDTKAMVDILQALETISAGAQL